MGDAFSDSSYCDLCGRKTGCYVGHYGGYCGEACYKIGTFQVGRYIVERPNVPDELNPWVVRQVFPWRTRNNFKWEQSVADRIVGRYVSKEVAELAAEEFRKKRK